MSVVSMTNLEAVCMHIVWSGVDAWWSGVGAWSGVDVTVTHNHIHLCGASVITSLFNYKNILLQERVINHRVKLYFCSKLSLII